MSNEFYAERLYCESCKISCSKICDWNRHINTKKHAKLTSLSKIEEADEEQCKTYTCTTCDRNFSNYKTHWAHAKKCEYAPKLPDYTTIITQLLSQNNELKNFIIGQSTEHKKETMEIVDKMIKSISITNTNTIVNTTTNNNQNNKFNINVFLNEECKDAMNFDDFIMGIEVTQEDIQNNGRLGFVDGITKIIVDNLNKLAINKRPIHCTDWKREILYIKNDNVWAKATDDNKVTRAIQIISQKSMKTLHSWKMTNPEYKNSYSAFALECMDMQLHSAAAHNRDVYYPKVIKLVAKHVMVDRKPLKNV